jgi:hypothetical protein
VLFYVFLCYSIIFCVVLCIVCFVTCSVLFVCICVPNYCHRVATQLLLNISYIIYIVYQIILYAYRIVSYIILYHIYQMKFVFSSPPRFSFPSPSPPLLPPLEQPWTKSLSCVVVHVSSFRSHCVVLLCLRKSSRLALFYLDTLAVRNSPKYCMIESSWNVLVHGDAMEGKWRGNWRMEWVAGTLCTTSEHGVSSITTADSHSSDASRRLNWRPCRFEWTFPFCRKTKSGFCACAITFRTQS